jgi:hypothetical protein
MSLAGKGPTTVVDVTGRGESLLSSVYDRCMMNGTGIELHTAAPTMALAKIIHNGTDLRPQELPIARSGRSI